MSLKLRLIFAPLLKDSLAFGTIRTLLVWGLAIGPGINPAAAEESHYGPEAVGHMQEGVRFLRAHQVGKARSEFLNVVKLEPDVPDAYNNIGLSYAYENNSEKAISYYKKALEKDPTYGAALNNLGLLLYSNGKPAEALNYWNRCLKTSTEGQPELHYYVANALRDIGQKEQARQHYMQSIEAEPTNAAAHSGLAALLLSDGALNEAYDEVTKAIKLKPDSAFAYYHLGLIEEKRGNAEAAVKAFESSLKYETVARYATETRSHIAKLNSKQPGLSWPNLGSSGASSDSGSALNSSTNSTANSGWGAFNSGSGSGSGSGAGAGAEPDWRGKAQSAMKRHAWKEAAGLLETITRANSEDAVAWNNLGLCQMHLGQTSRAVESYRHAIMIKRDGFPEAQYNLGMALRKSGDGNGAEAAFRKAIDDSSQTKKTNPLAQNMLGILLRERGDVSGADHAFRLAIMQSGSRLPVAHFNLGLLLERTEHSRDAVREYQTYLKLAPSGANAGSARIRLKRLTGA